MADTAERFHDDEYLEPYRPLPGSTAAAATGSPLEEDTELTGEEEPVATGTLFLMVILLMLIFGVWVTMYGFLLNR